MRRKSNLSSGGSGGGCRSWADKAALTVMCGLITLMVLRGSWMGMTSEEDDEADESGEGAMTTMGAWKNRELGLVRSIGGASSWSDRWAGARAVEADDHKEAGVKLIRKIGGGGGGGGDGSAGDGDGAGSAGNGAGSAGAGAGVGARSAGAEAGAKDGDGAGAGAGSAGASSSEAWGMMKMKMKKKKTKKTFRLGPKIDDWDERRADIGGRSVNASERRRRPTVLMVTGSAPSACENRDGDHFLLKSLKNKMDYAGLHPDIVAGVYNNMAAIPVPEASGAEEISLSGFWSKLPLLRRLMLARPEIEWLWWLDSDALVTDMRFQPSMHRYSAHNLVVHGWEHKVYVERSWLGLNTGSFFLRNCQWSLDLLDDWAQMGPKGRIRDESGRKLARFLSDRPLFEADDQSALVYLLITQRSVWGDKVFFESSFCLHGFWLPIVDKLDRFMADFPNYADDDDLDAPDGGNGGDRPYHGCGWDASTGEKWPFVTHFVGCKPCSKDGQGSYRLSVCLSQMERAYNFADNQIWRRYGLRHASLTSSQLIQTLNPKPLTLNP